MGTGTLHVSNAQGLHDWDSCLVTGSFPVLLIPEDGSLLETSEIIKHFCDSS
jgi:hypothetical protein